ncbi:hypothetical protein SLS60_001373 [Paraconiothyrium brasiliense]|uniref:DUF7730 domain-containing protein n=1 Tax=Paraconiothyrium brasiliense TaxID=300254 RepID=A0ABR3S8W5_9PLEO
MRIYELVLNGDNFLHLIPNYQKGKFGIDTSFLGRNADLFADVEEDTPRAVANGNHYENLDIMSRLKHYSTVRKLKSTPSLLSLLLTCRRVYAEAIPLLYSGNTFVISLGGNLYNFARSLPNIHLNRITSLVLYTPEPGWPVIDNIPLKLRNLKSCHIIVLDKFSGHSTHNSDEFEFIQKEARSSLKGHSAKDIFVIDIWSAVEAYLDDDGRRRGWVLTRRRDLRVESTGKHAEYLA